MSGCVEIHANSWHVVPVKHSMHMQMCMQKHMSPVCLKEIVGVTIQHVRLDPRRCYVSARSGVGYFSLRHTGMSLLNVWVNMHVDCLDRQVGTL